MKVFSLRPEKAMWREGTLQIRLFYSVCAYVDFPELEWQAEVADDEAW